LTHLKTFSIFSLKNEEEPEESPVQRRAKGWDDDRKC
jgi:hypothetical protein